MVSDERSELCGAVLDRRYHLGCCIGVGGTGVVFEAWRIEDGHPVVVKALRPVYAHKRDLLVRLRREAEVADRVTHGGVVPVYDEGTLHDGSPYIVMKRMGSESLSHVLRRRKTLSVRETAAIALRVTDILQAVHAAGYVHRDIKPEHVLLDRTPGGDLSVFLLDFGVCASATAPHDERERERGRVFGTPSYVSPEQAAGDPDVDGRADIYGLGVLMYECLSGRVPFSANTISNLLRRIIREDAPPISTVAPQADSEFERVLAQAVARFPEGRFTSPRAMGRALRPLLRDRRRVERQLAATLRVKGDALSSHTLEADEASAA